MSLWLELEILNKKTYSKDLCFKNTNIDENMC